MTAYVLILFLMASLEVLRVYWGKFGKILFLFRQSMSKKTTIGFSSSGVKGEPTGERELHSFRSDCNRCHSAAGALFHYLAVIRAVS